MALRRLHIFLLVAFALVPLWAECDDVRGYYPQGVEGLSGEKLLNSLRIVIRNHENYMSQFDENQLWCMFRKTDVRGDGTVWDMFSPNLVSFPLEGVPAGMGYCHIAVPEWIDDGLPYDEAMSLDLHNLFPCSEEVAVLKNDLIPWRIEDVIFDNGVFCVGYGQLSGSNIMAYELSNEYKGDIARVLMYIAACYGGEFKWYGQSWGLFNENSYPVFTNSVKSTIIAWHEQDPVDEKEEKRNAKIYELQGNRNPFVDYPELASHIWGDMIDEPFYFGGSGDGGEILKSNYSLDDKVWLCSQYVPDDATWIIDGKPVAASYIMANELGAGIHELRFTTASVKGKIIIEVR